MRTHTCTGAVPQVALAIDNDIKSARIVKGRLECTYLGQIARHIKVVLRPGVRNTSVQGQAYVSVRLNMAAIDALQLGVDGHTVKWSILGHPRIKLKEQHVRAVAQVRTRSSAGRICALGEASRGRPPGGRL
eukprot:110078-Chlamydomonas_euryale.AAC.4